jgi:predicted tellurium resistance membrane protein TerC
MRAVMSIIAADAFMSLDNVLALAAAAKGAWRLIVFGLLLSAPLVMFGAGLLSNLITRFPLLVWAGAAILGWAGGELIAADPAWSFVAPNSRPAEFLLGTIGGAGVLLSALVLTRRTGK